jgi:hypothetical protein
MQKDLPAPGSFAAKRAGYWQLENWLIVLLMAGIGAFYFWTVAPEGPRSLVGKESASYYNLLARGFLKGQLALDTPADPELARLANPYDPAQRAGRGMHDASYYKGRYYIYFGVTPVLVLFLPFKVLTGWWVSEALAVLLFSLAGFLVSVALLRSIAREHFQDAGAGLRLACVLVLGLATMVPPLLRRPAMWEVPISCGYLFFMLTLYCLWRAMKRDGERKWLVLASLAMGLGIGARPVYLLGSVMLLAPLIRAALTGGRGIWRTGNWWRLALCALGPIMAVGLGLALYNYLRFENPLEFGQTYQLAGEDITKLKLFSLSYFFYSLRIYLFSTPGLSPYFPFLTVISAPPGPPGQMGVEDPYGLVPGMPWVLLSLASLWLVLRSRQAIGWWCAAVWAGVLATMGIVFCFGGATGRYQVDFTPGVVLLGAVGLLALSAGPKGPAGRTLLVGTGWLLALWSAGFNVLASMQHNRLLQLEHPPVYARVAHAFNHLSWWYDRLSGTKYGPVELRVVFPRNAVGRMEPLVVTGREFLADYLYVNYVGESQVRFGFEHTSRGGGTGPVVQFDPEVEHVVLVQMGSLYPPTAHPVWDGVAEETARSRQGTVQVLFDGQMVFSLNAACYDSAGRLPSIGTSRPHRPGFPQDFSGRVLAWRRVAPLPVVPPPTREYGALHLTLQLPAFSGRTSDPLLCTGETGKGDLIYLVRLDERHVSIGHDRWAYGGGHSKPIEIDPGKWLEVVISCPPLQPPGAPELLRVEVGGDVVLEETGPFYPSRPDQIVIGANPIGSSMGSVKFPGAVVAARRMQVK